MIERSDLIPDGLLEDGGEWLFKSEGQVFGPVPERTLLEMLYRGELDGSTPVAGDDGAFRPLESLPPFVVHVKKAEAQLRVVAEVTGARQLRRRRLLHKGAAAGGLALAVLAAGGYGAWWLATAKPWQRRSALLEDFGGGIAIASPARVASGRRAESLEVEVPRDAAPAPEHARPPRRAAAVPARGEPGPAAFEGETGELVAVHYDAAHIRAVVARQQRTLAPCLHAESQRSPEFGGEVPVEFAIGNEGRVVQLWVDEPRFRHGELHECLLKTLQTWSFRPFPGQRPTVSLSFRLGGR